MSDRLARDFFDRERGRGSVVKEEWVLVIQST